MCGAHGHFEDVDIAGCLAVQYGRPTFHLVTVAIQSVQQQVRVLKLALEDKWKMKIPHTHSVFALDHRVFGFPIEQVRGGPRWQNGVRANEREEGEGARNWIRRNGKLEDEACTQSAREA